MTMSQFNLAEAKARFSELVQKALLGEEVIVAKENKPVVRIVAIKPALRCVMTTHRQEDLARDLRIIRAAAQFHKATVGVFASIGAAGAVSIGDPVFLSD